MKLLVDVKEEKAAFLLEVLKNFSFVTAKPLSENDAQILTNIAQAVHEVNSIKKGKMKGKPLSQLLDEL